MDITVNISDNCAQITISGMIDTLASDRLLSEVQNLHIDVCSIDFDLEQVAYISSSGLRVLLSSADMAGERGGIMRVVKSSDFVREIIMTVGFHKLFEVI